MEKFQLQILGCGSAVPTLRYNQSAQALNAGREMFLIDCGEGTHRQIKRYNVKTSRLNHIFISHLHGDHCFGIIGLITTLDMLGRTADLHIHSHNDLEKILSPVINYFCGEINFRIFFHHFNPDLHKLLYEDHWVKVHSIPLKHKIPTCGFIFTEKEKENHILTTPPNPPKKYAYCTDTLYTEKIIPLIEKIDCLFHESTFLHSQLTRAQSTMHTTALQAATIAQKANVKQLILGHYSARFDDNVSELLTEAKSVFENTLLGEDGKIFLI